MSIIGISTVTAASVGMRSKTATPFTVGRRSKVRTAADELWEEGEEEGGGATGGEGRGFDGENPLGTQVDEEVSSQGGVFKPVYAEDGFIMARREPARQVRRGGERQRERERGRERAVLCTIVLNVLTCTCTVNREYFDVKLFLDSMACAKIKRTKYMRNINDNAVQDHLSENYLTQKIIA